MNNSPQVQSNSIKNARQNQKPGMVLIVHQDPKKHLYPKIQVKCFEEEYYANLTAKSPPNDTLSTTTASSHLPNKIVQDFNSLNFNKKEEAIKSGNSSSITEFEDKLEIQYNKLQHLFRVWQTSLKRHEALIRSGLLQDMDETLHDFQALQNTMRDQYKLVKELFQSSSSMQNFSSIKCKTRSLLDDIHRYRHSNSSTSNSSGSTEPDCLLPSINTYRSLSQLLNSAGSSTSSYTNSDDDAEVDTSRLLRPSQLGTRNRR